MIGSFLRRTTATFGVLATACLLAAGLATTAAAAQPHWVQPGDIQVTVAYSQPSYKTDENLTATLTVTNNSDDDATNVVAYAYQCVADVVYWPNGFDTGITIPAHSTVTAQITGADPLYPYQPGTATCEATVQGDYFGVVSASATTQIIQAYGDYHAVFYRDRNNDGTFEPGEGVPGVTVTYSLEGDLYDTQYTVKSGRDGSITLTHVPTGVYSFRFSVRGGWVIGDPKDLDSSEATITETPVSQSFALTRPLSDRLHATMRFDQTSYQPGDTVHVTVTLANSGTTPITGVVADCNRAGDEQSLFPGAGWGELDPNGSGATIPAGTTRVLHVAVPLPAAAQAHGYVGVGCGFGPEPDGMPQTGFPTATDYADVPGLTSDTVLRIQQEDGTPLAGVQVRILKYTTHQEVANGVTDSNGDVAFPTLPANQYVVKIVGPWYFKGQWGDYFAPISPGDPSQPFVRTATPVSR